MHSIQIKEWTSTAKSKLTETFVRPDFTWQNRVEVRDLLHLLKNEKNILPQTLRKWIKNCGKDDSNLDTFTNYYAKEHRDRIRTFLAEGSEKQRKPKRSTRTSVRAQEKHDWFWKVLKTSPHLYATLVFLAREIYLASEEKVFQNPDLDKYFALHFSLSRSVEMLISQRETKSSKFLSSTQQILRTPLPPPLDPPRS